MLEDKIKKNFEKNKNKVYFKNYRLKNYDKLIEYSRKYYIQNRERILKRLRENKNKKPEKKTMNKDNTYLIKLYKNGKLYCNQLGGYVTYIYLNELIRKYNINIKAYDYVSEKDITDKILLNIIEINESDIDYVTPKNILKDIILNGSLFNYIEQKMA